MKDPSMNRDTPTHGFIVMIGFRETNRNRLEAGRCIFCCLFSSGKFRTAGIKPYLQAQVRLFVFREEYAEQLKEGSVFSGFETVKPAEY